MSQEEDTQNALIPFLVSHLEGIGCKGISWVDQGRGIFKILWKRYGTPEWNDEEAIIFQRWAEHRGRYQPGEKNAWTNWKTNLRNALRKNRQISELDHLEVRLGANPYHIYQFLPPNNYASPRSESSTVSYLDASTLSCGESMDIDMLWSMTTNALDRSEESSGANELDIVDNSTVCGSTIDDTSIEFAIATVNSVNGMPECHRPASTQMPCQTPCQDNQNDSVTSSPAQPISQSTGGEPLQGHEMNISLYYQGVPVHRQMVTNPEGCRIYYGIGNMLPEALNVECLCGPCGVDLVEFPDCTNNQAYSCLHYGLSALNRGLMLYCKEGDVYAARKCKITVFYLPPGCTEFCKLPRPEQYQRPEWVKIFDFNEHFLPTLKRCETEGGMMPKPEFTIAFGHAPEVNEHYIDAQISAKVVHLKALQLFENSEVRFTSLEISKSDECDRFMDFQEIIHNTVVSSD